ncbi:angiopoietin-related protein 7-like [Diadema setosum]|uniref:angiopoietin-related protein 7-like n=1 Tax=Diadema setosum TaxID=31175 RepID=UPI003B3A365B
MSKIKIWLRRISAANLWEQLADTANVKRVTTTSNGYYADMDSIASGVFPINPPGDGPFFVYCDMETDGGGWTLFQRRFSAALSFNASWRDYVRGFGDVAEDHWLGLEKLYRLAKQSVRLRVDMKRLDDVPLYAEYDFVLSDASELYRLRLANYRGNATDSLKTQNKMFFTTYDSDNDKFKNGNCAIARYGGWWYNKCTTANLNGRHWTESPDDQSGMRWNNASIKTLDKRVQVKDSFMMIRPLK